MLVEALGHPEPLLVEEEVLPEPVHHAVPERPSQEVPDLIAGDWSPYASPAVGMLGGRLHVAAVDGSGAVLVRAAVPGERSRMTSRIGTGDLTRSPGLVTRRNAGVFVVAGDRGTARLLTRPASAVVDRTLPRSAGFTP